MNDSQRGASKREGEKCSSMPRTTSVECNGSVSGRATATMPEKIISRENRSLSQMSNLRLGGQLNLTPTQGVQGEKDTPSKSAYPRSSRSEISKNPPEGVRGTIKRRDSVENYNQNFLLNVCEIPAQFCEVNDFDLGRNNEELDLKTEDKLPRYTKEYHLLTEVQKARILKTVEDVIKNLSKDEHPHAIEESREDTTATVVNESTVTRRHVSYPWMVLKIVQMALCHFIQVVILMEDTIFQRKNEFLPIIFTHYLTLLLMMASVVIQLSCFNSKRNVQNACYFMGAVSFSILTFVTTLGILIMLGTIEYYKTFTQIVILIMVAILLCLIIGELSLLYVDMKKKNKEHMAAIEHSLMRST